MKKAFKTEKTRNIILTGLFVALGLLVPYVTGHAAGLPGTVLLPMHLPVLLCGLLCGPLAGAVCGVVTPLVSSLITGMPALYPMLPVMAVELVLYGFVGGFLHRRLRLPVWASLPAAMLAGRAGYGLVLTLLTTLSSQPVQLAGVTTAVVTGLPGIALQLVLVPILVGAVERAGQKPARAKLQGAISVAAAEIREGEVSCIVIREGEIVHRDSGRGVSPLMRLYDTEEGRALLAGAVVADKIIGKGAAIILTLAGVREIYGDIMSAAACNFLDMRGIPYQYGRRVDLLSNRTGDGICPIEKSVLEVDDPKEGMVAIRETIAVLMANASGQ